MMKRERIGFSLIILVGIIALIGFALSDRIPQDKNYHSFADEKSYLSIPNTLNVLSNIPFLVVGAFGLVSLYRKSNPSLNIAHNNFFAYVIFFLGIALVGIGSSYYHLWPSNQTLLWDRLPMTLSFMALYSIIITEYISEAKGKVLLIPLLAVGVLSVVYWWYSESVGMGDLRYYAVVQFFPIVTIPIILIFFRSSYTLASYYWLLLGTYIGAKLFEHYDERVYELFVLVSGHSIKHLLPVIGVYYLLLSYCKQGKPYK